MQDFQEHVLHNTPVRLVLLLISRLCLVLKMKPLNIAQIVLKPHQKIVL